MIIEQTVEIPSDHRLTLEIPPIIPAGMAQLALSITPAVRPSKSLMDLYGSCKGDDTMEAYFERKRADKAHEEAIEHRWRAESKKAADQ